MLLACGRSFDTGERILREGTRSLGAVVPLQRNVGVFPGAYHGRLRAREACVQQLSMSTKRRADVTAVQSVPRRQA